MNREILFRAKRLDSGEWVCGYFADMGNEACIIKPYEAFWDIRTKARKCRPSEIITVDFSTVCQFTGLTDRNGVKIFEGDIIEAQTQDTKRLRNAEVRFGEFADINSDEDECYIGFYIVFDGIFTTAGQLKECSNSIEVIGNIFDQPELLGENNT